MTIGSVALALTEIERLLIVLHASSEAHAVRALGAFLRPHSAAKAAGFFKKAMPRKELGSSRAGQRVGQFVPLLAAYNALLARLASKTGKDFALLVEFLRRYENADLGELIVAAEEALVTPRPAKGKPDRAAADERLVADYVKRLQSGIGSDDEFARVFEPLRADKRARTQEVTEIAKRMMPAPPANMDRKKALAAIQNLHIAAKGFDLRLKASRGRSAA
jgi:hypothetical protein